MKETTIRRALLSVYDKTGVAQFAETLSDMGVEIISSGGTAEAIEKAGVKVRRVQEWTGFPEMLGHRVVTLHPKVHGAILALRENPDHVEDIEKYGIEPLDLVCVGLYPFEEVIAREGATFEDAVEMIDIGGPTMVRAAAKNHRYVTVVTEPTQYARVLEEMKNTGGQVSAELRYEYARQAFAVTAQYDAAISRYLNRLVNEPLPERLTLSYRKLREVRYGENPHQLGAVYRSTLDKAAASAAASAEVGNAETAVSFNNYYDADAALELVKEFAEPAVAIIKHANPAGVAVDEDLVEAYRKAYFGDVNAAMGGIIAVNRPVTGALAEAIMMTYNLWGKDRGAGGFYAEIILAADFEEDAVAKIRSLKPWGARVRLLCTGDLTGERSAEPAVKYVVGGLLVQERDMLALNEDAWRVVTDRRPDEREMDDLRFAWLVCKHVKSNAIALARDRRLLGAGAGQMSRVTSARLAAGIARRYGGEDFDTAGCAMASDAYFPFPDSLEWARDAGATAVIQPGGSKKDEAVIARANELGLAMVLTGTRHFNH